MDIEELRELVKLFEESNITEMNIEREGVRVHLKKEMDAAEINASADDGPVTQSIQWQNIEEHPGNDEVAVGENEEGPEVATIESPMVGIFYQAGSPEARPFVSPGQFVEEGEVVCIIEAMKLMNEIKSDTSGTVVDVLVDNGQPVEFGQPLFALHPA
jgi:acetyl-CoA carboxylase biotin carboxyl carrier protein